MKRKFISTLLIAAMTATMVAGCGGKSEEVSPDATTTNTTTTADSATAETTDAADDGEMADIVVSWMTFGPMDASKTDAVEEALNKITEEKINTHVDLQFFDPNTYATQVPMMIQANEKLDLLMYTPVPGAGYSSFKSQNQLMDISDLLNQYGVDVKTTLGDLIDGTSTSDGIYGVAGNRDMASSLYIIMRKDVLDQLGLTDKAKSMTSWTEFEDICKQVAEKTEYAPLVNSDAAGSVLCTNPYFLGSDKFAENKPFDNIGDTYHLIYADDTTDKVGCYYLSDEYKNSSKRAYDWFQAGLIYKDAATSQDMGDQLIKNGVGFATMESAELGVDEIKSSAIGTDVVCTKVTDSMLMTQSTYKFGFGVPVTATEPEAAVKFLNLLFTDADVENILAWGVEGRDWVKNDSGQATYPEGVTAETVAYHTADFLNGNQFITIPWEGNPADLRAKQEEAHKSAPVSKYMGFSFDATAVANELTACYNVGKQYEAQFSSGAVTDFDATYAEFKDKLTAAGIDKVIQAYQEQLDGWLAAKKVAK
jgi:putative aldouronate transport system substrate-binding protein